MAKANVDWTVLPHGPIERLAENLWWVQGDLPGMSLKRVMTVARLDDRRLVIHSAISSEPEREPEREREREREPERERDFLLVSDAG